jgi:hypothetical protein
MRPTAVHFADSHRRFLVVMESGFSERLFGAAQLDLGRHLSLVALPCRHREAVNCSCAERCLALSQSTKTECDQPKAQQAEGRGRRNGDYRDRIEMRMPAWGRARKPDRLCRLEFSIKTSKSYSDSVLMRD